MTLENFKELMHIDALRPFQNELLHAMEDGRDIMCLAPTSAGKSLVFQAFAMIREGLVVVIEPHLALELDQVRGLVKKGIPAAYVNSLLAAKERNAVLSQLDAGELRLLFVTPEMLQNKDIKRTILKCDIIGIMVDEAHCIAKQGPGFREDYLRIASFVQKLPRRPVVGAFTATATAATEETICEKLELQNPYRYAAGVTRKNIRLSAIEVGQGLGGRKDETVIEQRKREMIVKRLKKLKKGKAIIYTNTIARVEALQKYLKKEGFSVEFFHGKCADKERRLQDFAEGRVQIMVATNAFGLGVNIPDIRLIIHHAPLMGLDDYVQEAGRAGRDGKPAKALLLWHSYDFQINRSLIEKARMNLTGWERKQRLEALEALRAYAEDASSCRWRLIREFFGEDPGKRCKKQCDNCKNR